MKLLWPKNLLLLAWMAELGMRFKPFHYLGLLVLLWFYDRLKLLVNGRKVSLMRFLR